MKVSREFLLEHKTARGGWTNAQIAALGESWPPKKGWMDRVVKRDLSDQQLADFVRLRSRDESKKERAARKRAKARIKVAALEAKLAKGNNWTARKPARVGLTYDEANAPDFLSSYAWRSLRFRVLQHYGARCMCCGATPETGAVMNVDHIKPRRTHPHLALEFENLQVLCHDCNHGKANTVADFRPAPIEPEVREFLRAIARQ